MVMVNNRDKVKWHKDSYSLITVTVNGAFVAKEDYEEYEVPDNADVTVFHLAHGG
jgi:sulfur carrier protein ThiS